MPRDKYELRCYRAVTEWLKVQTSDRKLTTTDEGALWAYDDDGVSVIGEDVIDLAEKMHLVEKPGDDE